MPIAAPCAAARTRQLVVLGGQRIARAPSRGRASWTHGELALPTFEWAAGGDPLDAATMAAIAAGVSTRRYASTLEPVPAPQRGAVGVQERGVAALRGVEPGSNCTSGCRARSSELDLPVVMIDGIHFRDRVILVALGIDAQGNKHVLGLREGSTEATRVVARC